MSTYTTNSAQLDIVEVGFGWRSRVSSFIDQQQDEIERLTKQLAHWESGERDYADLLAEGRKMSLTLIDLTAERDTYKAMVAQLAKWCAEFSHQYGNKTSASRYEQYAREAVSDGRMDDSEG